MSRIDEINAQIAKLEAERESAIADNTSQKANAAPANDAPTNPSPSLFTMYTNRVKQALSGDFRVETALYSSAFKGAVEGAKEIYKAKEDAARAKEAAAVAQVKLSASLPTQEAPKKEGQGVVVDEHNRSESAASVAAKAVAGAVVGYKLGKWL